MTRIIDALWTYQTTYKTPIRMPPLCLIYEKTWHLPHKLNHKAYGVIKELNLFLDNTRKYGHLLQWKLEELRHYDYINAKISKGKKFAFHVKNI